MIEALGLYFVLLAAVGTLGIRLWKSLHPGERIIVLLIILTIIAEFSAAFASYHWHNNLPVYHIYSPIEFLLISLYFNHAVPRLRKKNVGIYVGLGGVVLSGLNTFLLQNPDTINSYFLLFEGTTILGYCMLSLHHILMREDRLPYNYADFWFTNAFMLYWSMTFTGWGIYASLDKNELVINPIFQVILSGANYVFYLVVAFVFINSKSLIPSGE